MAKYRTFFSMATIYIMLILIISACKAESAPVSPPTSNPEVGVDINGLPDLVSAEGIVVPIKEANLSFESPGEVEAILISEGELVEAGQALVRLDTRNLLQNVRMAEAQLKSNQAQLDKARAGARPEEIKAAEAAVAIAQSEVAAALGDVKVAKGNLTAAQADLQTVEDAILVAEGRLANAKATVASATANLNKLQAGPSTRVLEIAKKRVDQAKNELFGMQKQRDVLHNMNEGQLGAAEAAVAISELLYEDLAAGTRPEDLDIARAQISEAQAGKDTAEAQVIQAKNQVLQAQARVEIAEAQLEQANARVKSAQARVQQTQAELDLLKAGTRNEDIASAEAAVSQAEVGLAIAKNALEDAVLRAPFDGTVGSILIAEGELVIPQIPVVKLGDLSKLQVETSDLSEVDVNEVRVGQDAIITVDALGGAIFHGKVAKIAVVAIDRRGDKVYTVTVDLNEGTESGLRWGMTTFIEINIR